ncbi:VanZ family protein [bacterium]|nr:VanZ family protein [bacterium]
MNVRKPPSTTGARFLWYHLPVLLYAGLIIAASSLPNLKTPKVDFVALDKLIHFVEYSLFAWITFRSFSHIGRPISLTVAYLLSVLFVSLFAMADEYYQSFVPGRVMDVNDLVMDIGGAILVATFFWLRARRLHSLQNAEVQN